MKVISKKNFCAIVMLIISFTQCVAMEGQGPYSPAYLTQSSQKSLNQQPLVYHCPPPDLLSQQVHQTLQRQADQNSWQYFIQEMQKKINLQQDQQTALWEQVEDHQGQLTALSECNKQLLRSMQQQEGQIKLLSQQIQQLQQQGLNNNIVTTVGGPQIANNIQVSVGNSTVANGIFRKMINPKTLLISILILAALIKEGPTGAALVAGLAGGLLLCVSKEAFEAFKRKLKIGACGSVVAVSAGMIAITSQDKDTTALAALFVPISIGVTALALAVE
jgi:hypothetical protein